MSEPHKKAFHPLDEEEADLIDAVENADIKDLRFIIEEEKEEPIPLPAGDTEPTLDPPPAWDSLETEEPKVSEAEKEEFDL